MKMKVIPCKAEVRASSHLLLVVYFPSHQSGDFGIWEICFNIYTTSNAGWHLTKVW